VLTVFILLFAALRKWLTPNKSPAESSSDNWFIIWIVVIGVLNATAVSKEALVQQFLATYILLLAGYPIWRYLRYEEPGLPILPLITLLYGLYYALPALLPFEPYWRFIVESEDNVIQALVLTACGITALLCAFYQLPNGLLHSLVPRVSQGWSEIRARHLGIVLGVVGLAASAIAQIFVIPSSLGAIVHFFSELSLLAIAIFFLLQVRHRSTIASQILLWAILIPLQILIALGAGSVFPVIRLGAILLLIYAAVKRSLPWKWMAIGVPLILVALAVKMEFRTLTWIEGRTAAMNPLQKGAMFLEIGAAFVGSADKDELYFAAQTVTQRLDLLSVLAHVVGETPSLVPYWDGESYGAAIWKFIPRVVYPDKPLEEMGQTFGHRYNLLDEDDVTTSVNLAQLCEMYINFGTVGVVLGMTLFGMLLRVLYHSLNHRNLGSWGMVTLVTIGSGLLNIESNFSLVYGGLVYSLGLLYVLGLLVRGREAMVGFADTAAIVHIIPHPSLR
jgi:hypothetical protein